MRVLLQDLRYGLRMLARNPGFTAVAVVTLALGIGANTAMFSLLNGVLIRPLPYTEPGRLLRVTEFYPKGAVVALEQRSKTMEVAGFTTDSNFNLTGQGEALRVEGSQTSANLFAVLGVGAELGSTFRTGEDQPGRDHLVILSHALWQDKFGGDPAALGRLIKLDGIDRQIVGVMPPGFAFPSPKVQLWTPLHLDPGDTFDHWNTGFMPAIARLRPGATLWQARGELRPLIAQIIGLFPYTMPRDWNADATVVPLQQDLVQGVRGKLLILQGAVGIVLLVACVNVAGLLLARASGRQKEMALRAALGAGRVRIVRQLLTESVTLALVGGGGGLGLAHGVLAVLKSALPVDSPGLLQTSIDWQVFIFTLTLAVLTGLGFGLIPALSAAQPNLADSIKVAGRRSTTVANVRLRNALIAGELGLAVVLAVSAGLLTRSLWLLTQVNPGFRAEQILTVRVYPDQALCRERAACTAFYNEVLRQARGVAGVAETALANALPLEGEVPAIPAELEGHPLMPGVMGAPMLWAGAVTPDYFRVLGIPVVVGRAFTDGDGEKSAPVVIVSAATARRFWPGQNPIGKHLRTVWEKEWRTVVGVAGDVRQYDLADHSPSWIGGAVYMPYPQAVGLNGKQPTAMTLVARTGARRGDVAPRLHEIVASANPEVPVGPVQTMDGVVYGSASSSRSLMWLFISFAGSALLLAAIGIYGVVSYSTTQRTYEFGLRLALGATRMNIFGLVLRQSFQTVLAGLAAGTAASLALTRMLNAFLFGISATDPMTFLAVCTLLVAVALLAAYVPARRATQVDPTVALRYE